MDHLYSGSGSDDTVQFSTTSSLTFTISDWSDKDINVGGPKYNKSGLLIIIIHLASYIQCLRLYVLLVVQHNMCSFLYPI